MAFGIARAELQEWKSAVERGEIAYLTHYWLDERFPGVRSVTKVGCGDIERLKAWCRIHGLASRYIHYRDRYPHMDLFGPRQKEILLAEGLQDHIDRFWL